MFDFGLAPWRLYGAMQGSIYPWLLDLMLGNLNAPDELVYGQKTNLQTPRNHT